MYPINLEPIEKFMNTEQQKQLSKEIYDCESNKIVYNNTSSKKEHKSKKEKHCETLETDWLILGGGTSGCVFAEILSKTKSVIVVEAGKYRNDDANMTNPLATPLINTPLNPVYDWTQRGLPNPALNNRQFDSVGGKMLGGSSSHNGMQYVKYTKKLHDTWHERAGKLWSYEKALQTYKKLETYTGTTDNPDARGHHGKLNVTEFILPNPISQKFATAISTALNQPFVVDYNNPDTELGVFEDWQSTITPDGIRESSSLAFLGENVLKPPKTQYADAFGRHGRKLRVLFETFADKAIWDGKRVIGAEVIQRGKSLKIFAKYGVITTMGVHSPEFIQRSGVGPKSLLENLGIDVKMNNPNVGSHLINHPLIPIIFTKNPADVYDPLYGFTGGALLPSPSAGSDPNVRRVQMLSYPVTINSTVVPAVFSPFLLLVIPIFQGQDPSIQGTNTIQSKDPLTISLLDEQILSSPEQFQELIDFCRNYLVDIATELANLDPLYQLISPPLAVINSDDPFTGLPAFIRANAQRAYHYNSMCRMGTCPEDAVANGYGKVFGVKGLYVGDAQACPSDPDGNTQTAAYFIAYTLAKHYAEKYDKHNKKSKHHSSSSSSY